MRPTRPFRCAVSWVLATHPESLTGGRLLGASPPSGPINSVALRSAGRSRARVLDPGCSRNLDSPSAAGCASHFSKGSGGKTSGSQVRPLCSQAAATTPCQCCKRLAACAASSFTTLRSVITGTSRATPSSVAFCITRSMRSPRETPCTSVRRSGDSRSTATGTAAVTHTVLPRISAMLAVASCPQPSNSTSSSPGTRRNTRATWPAAAAGRTKLPPDAGRPGASTRMVLIAGLDGCRFAGGAAASCFVAGDEVNALARHFAEEADFFGRDDIGRHEVQHRAQWA